MLESLEQDFLKALQRRHANGHQNSSLSEIQGVMEAGIPVQEIEKARNNLVKQGLVQQTDSDGFYHVLTENGEHAI